MLVIIISSMSVPICNRFHTIWANNCKITSFEGGTLYDALVRGDPAPTGTKFCHDKLESLGQRMVKVLWF